MTPQERMQYEIQRRQANGQSAQGFQNKLGAMQGGNAWAQPQGQMPQPMAPQMGGLPQPQAPQGGNPFGQMPMPKPGTGFAGPGQNGNGYFQKPGMSIPGGEGFGNPMMRVPQGEGFGGQVGIPAGEMNQAMQGGMQGMWPDPNPARTLAGQAGNVPYPGVYDSGFPQGGRMPQPNAPQSNFGQPVDPAFNMSQQQMAMQQAKLAAGGGPKPQMLRPQRPQKPQGILSQPPVRRI